MIKVIKYYYTIKNLKFIQVFYRFKYIIKRKLYEKQGMTFFKNLERKFENQVISISNDSKFVINDRRYYLYDLNTVLDNKITFLNYEIDFGKNIDWHKDELNQGTRLWKLSLNYHEFLFDLALKFKQTKEKKHLDYIEYTVIEWFNQNPLGTKGYGKDNWNSYAISLRLISWIKMYILVGKEFSSEFKSFFLKLLWIQTVFLSENLELDILGNHLIKNWKALIWGKHFFKTTRFDKPIKITEKYVYPQFSEKGMHEEYSPMYAGIVLEDLMEVFLFQPNNKKLKSLINKLFENIRILSNKNQYLFFNDTTNNNGIQFDQLNDFYSKIFDIKKNDYDTMFNINGFVGFKTEKEHIVFDCAKVVGGNQPGHVQCDALSFEYFLKGKKIFTNSGMFEYNSGRKRTYSRSSESHNVLKYDVFDQSEVWGSFRMARQAKVDYKIFYLKCEKMDIEGVVRGFDFANNISHKRRMIKEKSKLIIKDTLIANTNKKSNLFFHLNPDLGFQENNIIEKKTKKTIAKFKLSHRFKIDNTEFYPEFGICENKETLVLYDIKPNEEVTTEFIFNE